MAEARKKSAPPRRRPPPARPVGDGGGRGRDNDYDDDDGENPESVAAHAAFVERHFGGGVPASAELLDRANTVWRRFPGAVVGVAGQQRMRHPVPTADDAEKGTNR